MQSIATIRAFFPKLGLFFPIFYKRQGKPPPSSALITRLDFTG